MLTMVTKAGKPTQISPTTLARCLLSRTIAQHQWESQVSLFVLRPVFSHVLPFTFLASQLDRKLADATCLHACLGCVDKKNLTKNNVLTVLLLRDSSPLSKVTDVRG